MATGGVSEDHVILLSNRPASLQERRLVFAAAIFLLVASGIAAPLATKPLPRFDAFIPSLEATISVNDLITSILLFAQYSIFPSIAILSLASGYLFTALIVIPHALTFPGAFAPTGLLGAGLQSTGWLYYFWHSGLPASVLAYACLKDLDSPSIVTKDSTVSAIGLTVAIVFSLVCGLTWLAIGGERFLPPLFSDGVHHIQHALYSFMPEILLLAVTALAFLWFRRRSILDYWLMLVLCALISEEIFIAILSTQRFSLGFYVGRVFSIVTSIAVLMLLLTETTRLYARAARSAMALERERENRLMNVEAITASIAHEVRQPLAAIATNGGAALRFIELAPPDVAEVRAALNRMIDNSHRASEVFDSVRALFGKVDAERQPVDLNELAIEVLKSLQGEIKNHGVITRSELTAGLPLVEGHRYQLREVIFNLVLNAVEAMDATTDRDRVLRVITKPHGRDAIIVAVEDLGSGVDPKRLGKIFDAFVTTKSNGMGLGLAICRAIVERHHGQITAWSNGKGGALFQFVLPIRSTDIGVVRSN